MGRLLIFIALAVFGGILSAAAQIRHRIWDGTGEKNRSVTLEEYRPTGRNSHVAVVVCPGGSYSWLDYDTEGVAVAKWLSSNGITAFVLKYRVQGKFQFASHSRLFHRGRQHPDMLMDIQRALVWVRTNAERYGTDRGKVGAMGFSAGGHLVMSAAEYFGTDFYGLHFGQADAGTASEQGLDGGLYGGRRPDFVAPIYPVVSMSHDVTHTRSRRALLGEYRKFSKTMRDSLSLEKHVPKDCPPVFLVNCKDDPIVKYENSVLLDSALTAQGIDHRYIMYQTGGHGFGASDSKGTTECRRWKEEFLKWLRETNIMDDAE